MTAAEIGPAAPPHDTAAEQVIIGALMSGAALPETGALGAADFYRPAHRVIFEAITDLAADGCPVDPVAVNDELWRRGDSGVTGGAPYLHTCLAAVPSAAQAGYYARIVVEHAVRRRIGELAARLAQAAAWPGDPADLADTVAEVTADLTVALVRLDLSGPT